MVAGVNCFVDIWRIDYDDDDVVGGAMITGSLKFQNYPGFLQAKMPEQLLLQQGLETERTFQLTLVPGTLDIRERDEVEVAAPPDHMYFGDRFRVRGVEFSNHNPRDPRNYMILQLGRNVRAHERQ